MIDHPFWWFPALKTLAAVMVLAAAYWPWTTRVCRGLPDRGAGWAVPGGLLGFLLTAQLLWKTGIAPPGPAWLWTGVGLAGLAGWLLHTPFQGSVGTRNRMRISATRAVAVFAVLFFFWTWIRAADPGIQHTEQPMDLMWMRAALASDSPPIRDAWLGHAPSTYYAAGHQALAFLSALVGEPVSVGYNLGQITWFALTGVMVFLTVPLLAGHRKTGGCGVLGVALVLFVSTVPGFQHARGDGEGLWWWDASRVIRENGWDFITEFPFFSFWLGDNHAHVLGLPVLILAVAASTQVRRCRRITFSIALPAGLALAWSLMINPWQAPTALALAGVGVLGRKRFPSPAQWPYLAGGFALPILLVLPMGPGLFQGISTDLAGHTNPREALRVFGWMAPGLLGGLLLPRSRWLGLLFLLCAGMFATCEVVRVVDAFQNRMNTVFKVYYQLWVLLGILSAAGWAAALRRGRWRIPALATLLFPTLGLVYAARLSGSALASNVRTLDALQVEPASFRTRIRVADRLIRDGDRIAEAPGESFQPAHSHLGTWTGGANVIGWTGHQHQWRPGAVLPSVDALYTARDPAALHRALRNLDVQWVWIGHRERATYGIHPDLPAWLDRDFNRVIDQPAGALWETSASN